MSVGHEGSSFVSSVRAVKWPTRSLPATGDPSDVHVNTVIKIAAERGLAFRGGFAIDATDAVPAQADGRASRMLLLFGQAGRGLWPVFARSPEFADGQAHPLDRWSRRIGDAMASELDALALYPFGPAPFRPFVQWAMRAEAVRPSRLGLLIHPEHGLWHAYRFAIALPVVIMGLPPVEPGNPACDRCRSTPCLSACPVEAFDGSRYDLSACSRYLQANPRAACHREGCLARDACPEGERSRYAPEQRRFHIRQFVVSLQGRSSSGRDA